MVNEYELNACVGIGPCVHIENDDSYQIYRPPNSPLALASSHWGLCLCLLSVLPCQPPL